MVRHKLLLLGASGAGKTTIMMELHEEFNIPYLDIRDPVIEIIKHKCDNSATLSDNELKAMYKDFIKQLETTKARILEIANDWPETYLDPIINTFKPARIVYVDTPLQTCMERMLYRKFAPPEYRVKNHHKYRPEYYQKKAEEHKIPFLLIDGTKDFLGEYQKVKNFIKR